MIDAREASRLSGVPIETLKYWRRQPGRPGPKWTNVGRRVMYQTSDVIAWVEAQFTGEAHEGRGVGGRPTSTAIGA